MVTITLIRTRKIFVAFGTELDLTRNFCTVGYQPYALAYDITVTVTFLRSSLFSVAARVRHH